MRAAILEKQGDAVEDVDLARMAAVESIAIYPQCQTPVTDLAWVAPLKQLKVLHMNEQPVADLTPLAAATALEDLSLISCRVAAWPEGLTLPRLKHLTMQCETFGSVAGLERETELIELHLFDTPVSDIALLAALTRMETLNLSRTAISSLEPLRAMTRLRSLVLYDLRTEPTLDLAPIAALPLEELSISQAKLVGVEQLARLSTLRTVDLSYTDLATLDVFAAASLTDLRIVETQVPEDAIEAWSKAHPKTQVTTEEEVGD